MPGELRARVIRLAHERPELRPHLLPILAGTPHKKKAYTRVPDDFVDFAYKGPRAETAGLQMANAVKDAIQQMKAQARTNWKALAARLMANEDVESNPGLARHVVATALMDTYAELSEKALPYFKSIP